MLVNSINFTKYVPTHEQIKSHCLQQPEEESIGFVIDNQSVYEARNAAEDKTTEALLDPDDFILAEQQGEITALYHSHCLDSQPAELSDLDVEAAKNHDIPVIVYHTKFDQWDYFDPNNDHPFPLKIRRGPRQLQYYLDWKFVFNRSDCLSLFRSFYSNIFGVKIKDYPRPLTEKFPPEHWDDYAENFGNEGFSKVEGQRKYGDVLLMSVFAREAHHVGIWLNDREFLHLLKPGELSRVQYLDTKWEQKIKSVWRHKLNY